ncbi:hypothetical protein JW824_06415 [bacterium]|nr:hypothetical protein [bacterium]RQV95505.1 MAG: hypothetical protein EH221_05900 [bacterium]
MLIQKDKKILFIILITLLTVCFIELSFAQDELEYFSPVPDNGNYRWVQIDSATINGTAIEVGDEIGIFDDNLCVGAIKFSSFPLILPTMMQFVTPTIPPDTLLGAISGHKIYFRLWDKSEDSEIYADATYSFGNGTFGADYTTVNILEAVVTEITIGTYQSEWGLPYYINGQQYTAQKTFYMNIDSTYTLSVDSLPTAAGLPTGERYRFEKWSNDSTDATINYKVPSSPASITANFLVQYLLTTEEDPEAGGDITPAIPGAWYDRGTNANVSATAATGYQFTGWSGDLTGSTTPTIINMNAPKSVTAHFTRVYQITVKTNPVNLLFSADGNPYSTTQTFVWLENSVHSVAVTSPQSGGVGTQYVYSSWSDVGNQSHNYTVSGSNDTVTANFTTQHLLTVTSTYGTTTGGGWYNKGASAQFSISPTIVDGGGGTRHVFTDWLGSGSYSYTGTDSIHTVTMNNPITETANWKTQYKLTINAGQGSATGAGWYDAGASAPFSLDSTLVYQGSSIRYQFTSWVSSDPGGYSGIDSSRTVTMNNAITEDALWQTQYRLTTFENPVEGGDVVPSPGTEWWYNASVLVPISATPAGGYQFAGWSGSLMGTTNPTNITMDGPKTVFANFGKEVQVTVQAEPSGLDFIVDGSTYSTPQTYIWIENGLHTLAAVTPQDVTPDSQIVLDYWIDSRSSTSTTDSTRAYLVPANTDTVTVHYKKQFYLTVNTSMGSVSGEGWYDDGSNATFSVDSMAVPVEYGTQYRFDGWTFDGTTSSDSAYTVSMDSAITATAGWQLQHGLLVQTAYGTTSGTNWYDAGSSATFYIDSLVVPDTTGMRHFFTGWTGLGEGSYTGPDSSHTVTMDYPKMETAGWKTQYYLTTHVNPAEAGTVSPTPGTWYDSLSVADISATPSEAYLFAGWNGDHYGTVSPDTVWMNRPKNVTANFGNKVLVTVMTVPSGRDFIVNDTTYTSEHTFSWIENSSHVFSVTTPQSGVTGKRYNFDYWTWNGGDTTTTDTTHIYMVPMNGDTVIVHFTTQYLLTVNSAYGTATGGGWYNAGVEANFSVSPITISISAGVRQFFSGWSGNGGGSYSGTASSYSVTMNNPITETANWNKQFRLTVTSAQGTTTGDGWYNENAFATFSVGPTSIYLETGIRHFFMGWTGTFSGPDSSYTIQMDTVYTETANWHTQYLLTTNENPDAGGVMTPSPPGGWYDSGIEVPVTAVPTGNYEFAGWTGDLTGTATPDTITMNGPKVVTANFGMAVEVLIQTEPTGLEFLVNGTPYTTSHTFDWIGTSQYTLSVNSPQSGGTGLQYVFDSWTDGGNRTHVYTVTNEDDTVTVTFETQHLLTVTSTHGTALGGGWYAEGEEATFSVSPLIVSGGPTTRYVFTGWAGSGSGSYTGPDSAHTVTMNNAITETAQWITQQSVTLTTQVVPPGTGTISVTPSVLFPNTMVTLIATPATFYVLDHWSGAVTGSNDTTQFIILSNTSVIAHFANLDTLPPYVANLSPQNGAQKVPVNSGLAFRVLDTQYGVDLTTLDVSVLGTPIIQNGVDQTGGQVDIIAITNGYYVYYSPVTPFTASLIVTVTVNCSDLAQNPNTMTPYSYSFTTGNSRIGSKTHFRIPPGGGTITDTSGIKIIIPSPITTFVDTIWIGILQNPPAFPDSLTGVGLAYMFGPPGLTFSAPIKIQLPITQSAFVNSGALSLNDIDVYYFNTATGQWEKVSCTVDKVNMVVTFTVTHFSIFSLAAPIVSGTVDETEINNHPNPFNPDQLSTCIQYNLKEGAEVSLKVYDSSGRLVRILEEDVVRDAGVWYSVFWDGKNGNGDIVANNVYFCILEIGTDQKIVRKIAVLR